jgi:murein DD-endopeptidase MepM/ murein hydrolase activator NlpD
MMHVKFEEWLRSGAEEVFPIMHLNQTETWLALDLSVENQELQGERITDTISMGAYIQTKMQEAGAKYGVGGYNEHRALYARSEVFSGEEPRRIHLGIDIWGEVGTPVFAPLLGRVHSFAMNNAFGDYGATIILEHNLEGSIFYTLYGHLSARDLEGLYNGKPIAKGEEFAHLGEPHENGHWPPHLHFQCMLSMQGKQGDYPGVCSISERNAYLDNCPNPAPLITWLKNRQN